MEFHCAECFCRECICDLATLRRERLQSRPCKCVQPCQCSDKASCFREEGEEGLCICGVECKCKNRKDCKKTSGGCICIGECTCGRRDICYRGPPEPKTKTCACGPNCTCYNQDLCFHPPPPESPGRPYPEDVKCVCGATCQCSDRDQCYRRRLRKKWARCVCGSGLDYADCPCYNKEECFLYEPPPCACGEICLCYDREQCFPKSKIGKCWNCGQDCKCSNEEFCQKLAVKKKRCACGMGKECHCYDQDLCKKVDFPIPKPLSFTDKIGRRPKPVKRILPLKYEKYGPGGTFKTPYHTSVMVKFLDNERTMLLRHPFQITANVHELRRDLSIVFKIPMTKIILRSHGVELHPTLILAELGYKPYDVCELFLDWSEKLEPIPDYYALVIPDIITIRVMIGQNLHKDIVMEIEDKRIEKPFIGGYRNKKTGIEYHHAFTQTGLRASKIPHELQNNRDTQTNWLRNRLQETKYSHATQMTNSETWIPNVNDKIMEYSGCYETADEWECRLDVEGKVRTIQRYFWAWKMKKALKCLHEEYWNRIRNAELDELERLARDKQRRHDEVVKKVYPRTRADYAMLYGMLDKWKRAETERINQTYSKAPRLAELAILLDKEVKILGIIEKHRKEVRQDMKDQKEIDFFDEISTPVMWNGYKHIKIKMHTEKVQRGQRYKDLYFALCRRDLSVEKRLQLLLAFKYAIKDHNCALANEIQVLLDRECNLLVRNFDGDALEVLRLRIQKLFLEHVRTPQCNDCLTKRPRGLHEIHMEKELCYCKRCETLKNFREFPQHSRMGEPKICTVCTYADISKRPYIDIAPYRFIKEMIIVGERRKSCETPIIYMINDRDIQYLVDRIWHGHSIITEARDLYDLRLARWDNEKPWSPWNCVLLTEQETAAHARVTNPTNVYGDSLCHDIENKHLLGKKKFAQMFYVNEFFETTGELKTLRETFTFTPVPTEVFCNEKVVVPDLGPPEVKEFDREEIDKPVRKREPWELPPPDILDCGKDEKIVRIKPKNFGTQT